jgi:shikimate kinase
VGRVIADRWNVPYRDTDEDVEARAGKEVSVIFIDDGEETFRTYEREAVRTAVAEHRGVLALGGGAVLDQRNRDLLHGLFVVFLDVDLNDAVTRVGLARERPWLLPSPRAHLRWLLDQRRPIYLSTASVVVSTTQRTPEEIADDIEALRK